MDRGCLRIGCWGIVFGSNKEELTEDWRKCCNGSIMSCTLDYILLRLSN
jgi:hypothetical protein